LAEGTVEALESSKGGVALPGDKGKGKGKGKEVAHYT